jgi:Uma2 family endonuclease
MALQDKYPDPTPPLLVVEVISPTDKASDIRDKREIYLKAMILYWEMYPQTQSVDVYAPDKPLQSLHLSDMLDGGDVLPGFRLSLKDLFRD